MLPVLYVVVLIVFAVPEWTIIALDLIVFVVIVSIGLVVVLSPVVCLDVSLSGLLSVLLVMF